MEKITHSKKLILITVVTVLLLLIFERAFIGGNSWRYTHWLFDYEFEFIKRGLIGQILTVLNVTKSYDNLEYIWTNVTWILSIIFLFILSRNIKIESISKSLILFTILALTSSATLQHFVYDFGRFDSINLIIAMLLLIAIPNLSEKKLVLVIPFFSLMMILIHEASFFLFVPLIVSYWYVTHPHYIKLKLIVLLSITIFTLFVSTNGKVKSINLQTHHSILVEKYGDQVSASSLNVLHRNLDENLEFTATSIDTKRLYDHLAFALTFLPVFILFFKIFKAVLNLAETNFRHILLIISCFAPLALYPLGEDHFRWWTIVITNIFITLSLLAYRSDKIYQIIFDTCHQHKKLIYTAVIFSILLGPLGNPSAYPFTINQYIIHTFEM